MFPDLFLNHRLPSRVQNASLRQIENGHVALPNVDLLADPAQVYRLDFWNLMWRAGYRIPKKPPPSTSPDEDETPLNIQSLENAHRGRAP